MGDFEVVSPSLSLPSVDELMEELQRLTENDDAAARCAEASRKYVFVHPDGRRDFLGSCRLAPEQVALISHLSKLSPTSLSIDVGFGMGTSATMTLASRRSLGQPFTHVAVDPSGLGDGRGQIVEEYLRTEFSESFQRIFQLSQIGLGLLYREHGPNSAGFAFIDGSHTFENILVDFVLCDMLMAVGGHIAFDDAYYPGIETAVNYIKANRKNYAVSMYPVANTVVFKKIDSFGLDWCSFNPFEVADRKDWTPLLPEW